MKFKSLENKLELYYNTLQNPKKVIDNWNIVDIKAYENLKKNKILNINTILDYPLERTIILEIKNKYLLIKYSPNFIASKIIDTEYDYILKDWDLIAVDTKYLHTQKITKILTNKELIQLLEIKLTKKAIKDLDYFD